MDDDALEGVHEVLSSYVDGDLVPGVVAAVACGDEVHVEVLGHQAFGAAAPMRSDTLFRLTSMTKPMVAVAALTLVDDGRLVLDDPVDRLLPELADRQVLVEPDGPLNQTVPAERPITVDDVLTFRLGYGTPAADFPSWPLFQQAERLGLCLGPPLPRPTLTSDEWIAALGTLPLLHQPGERWRYDLGASVLGVLIERAAGAPLPEVLHQQVLRPLGMHDTAWHVDDDDLARLATAYGPEDDGSLTLLDPGDRSSAWAEPPVFPDGASGLVSTVGDCVTFGSFLLGDGTAPSGEVVLRPETLAAMTTDQLTPGQRDDPFAQQFLDGGGWGYGVGVDGQGRYRWAGGFGTVWRNVPSARRVEVLLTQRAVYPAPTDLFEDFWAATDAL